MRTKWWSGALAAVTAGAVSELTLAEVKRLRFKVGLGGSQAPLTDERVPTLAERWRWSRAAPWSTWTRRGTSGTTCTTSRSRPTRSITGARVWINTLWYGQAAGYTDESSLRDPAQGWGAVVDRHYGDMIQTDKPRAVGQLVGQPETGPGGAR